MDVLIQERLLAIDMIERLEKVGKKESFQNGVETLTSAIANCERRMAKLKILEVDLMQSVDILFRKTMLKMDSNEP